jgi:carboxymethylenebutenolidase
MKSRLLLVAAVLLATATVRAQDWAKARLEKTPRHLEWVTVKQGSRDVKCSIAYPEVKDKATAVILIHEIFGLTDWVRGMTDQLAEAGYIVIAPDFLSTAAPNGGGSAELGIDGSRGAIGKLPPDQITADLNAVMGYVSKLPACNGKVVVAGFCWGGGQAFRFATNNKAIKATLVFYGTPPPEDAIASINAPIYGFYGGNDARVTATVAPTTELMKKAGKAYQAVVYDGAGHGFMRLGEDPTDATTANHGANVKARDAALQRWLDILKTI